MIVGWIRTSIDPPIRSSESHVPDSLQLWESLKHRFSVKNSVRKHLLEDEITNCKQNGETVLSYFGRLFKLWEELQNFISPYTCACEASTHNEKEREDAKVHKFLFGLDDSRFSAIRSQIIDEEPLPDLNLAYSRVIRAEQHILTMRTTELKQDVLGFAVKTDSSTFTPASSNVTAPRSRDPNHFCIHCNRKGHEASEGFILHGYPKWFNEQQKNAQSSGQSQRGRGGHGHNTRGRGRANTSRAAPSTSSGNSIAS